MRWIDDAAGDLRYALRQMRRAPLFAAIATGTLALGIGATIAIFSIVHAVLMRPLPYADADGLVHIVQRTAGTAEASADGGAAYIPAALDAGQLASFRAQATTLSHVVAHGITTLTLTGQGDAVRLDAGQLSADGFDMLGVRPLLGRTFALDDPADAEASVVLSHATWQRYFGADPRVIGRVVLLDGRHRSIVGVMPPRFAFPDAQTHCWIPYVAPVATAGMRPPRIPVIARVKNGVTMEAAASEVNAILQWLGAGGVTPPGAAGTRAEPGVRTPFAAPATSATSAGTATSGTPAGAARPFELVRFSDRLTGPVRPALLVLSAAVACVLSIAWVNVANLLLARAGAREREFATRLAIGADRGRLMRQMLTESVCLACIGGAAGTALAFGGLRLLRLFAAPLARRDLDAALSLPRLDEVGIDTTVLAFTLAVSVLTGVLFGAIPALRQTDVHATGARRHRALRLLVVAQVGMALLLFVGGGLLARSVVTLSQVDPGYEPAHVLTFQLAAPPERSLAALADDLASRLRSHPGVGAAGYTRQLPMLRARSLVPLRTTAALPLEPAPPPAPAGTVNPPHWPDTRHVSRDYLAAMRIRVTAGRGFDARDAVGQPQVLLINESLARSGLLGPNPIGRQVYTLGISPWEVIGVVDDVRQSGLDQEPGPQLFMDLRQLPGAARLSGPLYFVVRVPPWPRRSRGSG